LPDNLKRKKLCRALEKLGFEISTRGGNGSHIKATYIQNQKCIIIPDDLRRDVLYYILKEIESVGSVTWDDIKRYL
jgi:predicted RNA binding protein YcfA (HicA-like mRNA interferase family)